MPEHFEEQCKKNIEAMSSDDTLSTLSLNWIERSARHKYSYNFSWMGRPIIQYPQDILAMQEIIWQVKPDLIIETGVAHGGSILFYSSMLELIGEDGTVIGIDIDIRDHNREAILAHPMSKRITLIEGSSVDPTVVAQIKEDVKQKKVIMVILDSNHTYEHVLEELHLYSPFVTSKSYLVVFDTIIDDLPTDLFKDRPWSKTNNPKLAVADFLRGNVDFYIDENIDKKLLISVAPSGYLVRR